MKFSDLFKTTIVSVGPAEALRIGATADRAWWDTRHSNNPDPVGQPAEGFCMDEINQIRANYGK